LNKEKAKSTLAKKKEGYGYKYTELAQINTYCDENNIKYYQEIETSEINQQDYMVTFISEDGGDYVKHRGCKIVDATLSGIKNPVQEYGSSLTYCRRYSLLMALGLATEDDDGASLTEVKEVTLEDAKSFTFEFGKYKGSKLVDVIKNNNGYIQWLLKQDNTNPTLLKCIELLTGEVAETEAEKEERIQLTKRLQRLLVDKGCDLQEMLDDYDVSSTNDLTIENYRKMVDEWENAYK